MKRISIKPLYTVLLIVALLVIVIGATVAITQSSPRYTADQVIAVVHAYDPDFRSVSVSVEYEGQGIWTIKVVGYQTGIFYEHTGQLEGISKINIPSNFPNRFRD